MCDGCFSRHIFKRGDYIIYAISIAILVIIDQITKYLTVQYLKPIGSVEFIPNIINLTYAENRGAAFGMLQNQRLFFVIITFFVLGLMFCAYKKRYIKHKLGILALIFISGGAIGNLVDRIILGYVVDMIDLAFMKFAIFNFADMCISVGGAIICYYIVYLYDKDNPKEVKNAENTNSNNE